MSPLAAAIADRSVMLLKEDSGGVRPLKTHYTLGAWADFVRGLLPLPQHDAMAAHASGCKDCRTLMDWLQQVQGAAQPVPDPPADVVQRAREIFVGEPANSFLKLPRQIARMVYDSLSDPLPAPVRTLPHGGRQALFEAGTYCVDLRLERDRDSNRVSLTGQLASREHPDKVFSNLPVMLSQGEKVVLRTTTNDQGEFYFDYETKRNLQVLLPVPEWTIVLRLNELRIGRVE